ANAIAELATGPCTPSVYQSCCTPLDLHSFPTRRSSDLPAQEPVPAQGQHQPQRGPGAVGLLHEVIERCAQVGRLRVEALQPPLRSEEHTSELQSRENLVCRLLLEKKKYRKSTNIEHARV